VEAVRVDLGGLERPVELLVLAGNCGTGERFDLRIVR